MAQQVVRTAGQVARLLGVPESTLRAWHRRYGVGPLAPRPGGYRRYTADDVSRLERMCDLIRTGVLPSDAAQRIAEDQDDLSLDRVLPDLLAAGRDLDTTRCLRLLARALAGHGVVRLWEELCRPALAEVDADQCRDGAHGAELCVAQEHALSWAISATLHRAAAQPGTSTPSAVMLACTDGENHTLPLEALAAALAELGIPVRMLGGAVPTPSLVHAVTTARPTAVVLWAQRRDTAIANAVSALRGLAPERIVAGPGWTARRLRGTTHVSSLSEAVDRLAR